LCKTIKISPLSVIGPTGYILQTSGLELYIEQSPDCLNRHGGHLFLGVEDDTTIKGIPEDTSDEILNNFVKPKYLFHGKTQFEEYLKDPLIERRITAHLANEIVNTCLLVQKERAKVTVPVLVMASGNDRIVSFDQTENWFRKLEAPQKSMIVYPELYHEIFSETENDRPFQDLKKFFIAHLGGFYAEK